MSHKPRRFIRRSCSLEESQSSTESTPAESQSSTSSSTINVEKEPEIKESTPPPIVTEEPKSPIIIKQNDDNPNDSGGSVQLISSPKKKRRFHKNVQSQDSSSLNTSFTSDSVENSQMMDLTEHGVDSPDVKEIRHEIPPQEVNNTESDETMETIQQIEEEPPKEPTKLIDNSEINEREENEEIIKEIDIKEEEVVKKQAKRGKKKKASTALTVLKIDSSNSVTIGGKKFPVKKLSKLTIVDLTEVISELEDYDDLPVQIRNLMEENPKFFSEDRHNIKQTCFLSCPVKAVNTKKEELTIDFMFTQTKKEVGFVSFKCHMCNTKQGCRMICCNAYISNKREFYEKHNLTPDPNFQFIQRLPCMISTCKDCFDERKLGNFEHYLFNGDWICTHCRALCTDKRCTRKCGINTDDYKYNGINALEQFKLMASDKSDHKKILANNTKTTTEVKQEPKQETTAKKRGRPAKKEIKVESSESEEEEEEIEMNDESSESEEEVKITKRVTRSSKASSSSASQSSSTRAQTRSTKKVKPEEQEKAPSKVSRKTPEKNSASNKKAILSPPKQPSISPHVKREMASNNAKEIAKYLIGAFNAFRPTSNVNSPFKTVTEKI